MERGTKIITIYAWSICSWRRFHWHLALSMLMASVGSLYSCKMATRMRHISPKMLSVKCCHLLSFCKEAWSLYFGQEMCYWADMILSGKYEYATPPIGWIHLKFNHFFRLHLFFYWLCRAPTFIIVVVYLRLKRAVLLCKMLFYERWKADSHNLYVLDGTTLTEMETRAESYLRLFYNLSRRCYHSIFQVLSLFLALFWWLW